MNRPVPTRVSVLAAAISIALACGVVKSTVVLGQTRAQVDPAAVKALERMGGYLRTLKSFQLTSKTSTDEVLDDGQRIAFDATVDLLAQMPDRLTVEVTSDRKQRIYYYDGTSFTLWAPRVNYYATVAAPSTIAQLHVALVEKYDLELPLGGLFFWGTERQTGADLRSAVDIGTSQVEGVSCEHYAFRQEGLDWQIWIQAGDYPLPRKLVLTTTTDEARPQFTSVMTWNLAPSYNDAAFKFVPPKDAQKITFLASSAGTGK